MDVTELVKDIVALFADALPLPDFADEVKVKEWASKLATGLVGVVYDFKQKGGKIDPERWKKLIDLVIKVLPVILPLVI